LRDFTSSSDIFPIERNQGQADFRQKNRLSKSFAPAVTGIVRIHAAMSGFKIHVIRLIERVSKHKRTTGGILVDPVAATAPKALASLTTLPKLMAAAAICVTAFAQSLQPATPKARSAPITATGKCAATRPPAQPASNVR
jgi:hypothetical protein